jgi:hypothetical protein
VVDRFFSHQLVLLSTSVLPSYSDIRKPPFPIRRWFSCGSAHQKVK